MNDDLAAITIMLLTERQRAEFENDTHRKAQVYADEVEQLWFAMNGLLQEVNGRFNGKFELRSEGGAISFYLPGNDRRYLYLTVGTGEVGYITIHVSGMSKDQKWKLRFAGQNSYTWTLDHQEILVDELAEIALVTLIQMVRSQLFDSTRFLIS
ncbi:MAG TPA: hypothetical protein VKK31_14655 [Thermoanaerobaculia bacterium]|nr:hypothetical protein [Thermoanaerobaculia bacterium]